jgi:formate hydrogenlyase subunit 3/multisubunit Na+/H+ antiporter MnhD subunit
LDGKQTGLISRYPVSAFGFLFGMLAMLGIPPTLGFIGRWRLYETTVQIGWPVGAVFILSSILALVAYVLALTGTWWGPGNGDSPADEVAVRKEPLLLRATIVTLVVLVVVAGVWPKLLEMLGWGRL